MKIRNLTGLKPHMQRKAQDFVQICADNGLDVLIYCTSRTLADQARLYRQSRTFAQIQKKEAWLRRNRYDALADILMGVGAQSGKLNDHVTYAACGESLHNYGLAFDGVPMVGGKLMWGTKGQDLERWMLYGECAKKAGLSWAGEWTTFREFAHCQCPTFVKGNPLKELPAAEVYKLLGMPERFVA